MTPGNNRGKESIQRILSLSLWEKEGELDKQGGKKMKKMGRGDMIPLTMSVAPNKYIMSRPIGGGGGGG